MDYVKKNNQGYSKSLGLLNTTQLRQPRKFQFNGRQFETRYTDAASKQQPTMANSFVPKSCTPKNDVLQSLKWQSASTEQPNLSQAELRPPQKPIYRKRRPYKSFVQSFEHKDAALELLDTKQQQDLLAASSIATADSNMDYITLAGYLLGFMASNVLFFMCWYFTWLKEQVFKLRHYLLGHCNLWEFFDCQDTARYSFKSKLLLLPVIVTCSLLFCMVNVMLLVVKLVRLNVPRNLMDSVQLLGNTLRGYY